MILMAKEMESEVLNEAVRLCQDRHIELRGVNGQRYIGDASSDREITIYGTAGNALGAYLDGTAITVYGNAQDAVGDTMNAGTITVHGRAGDTAGYGMRGGTILVKGDIGYRAGIHMKAFREQSPVLIAGGCAGSFLGEYLAGGTIVIFGIGKKKEMPAGNFCGSGMHGGRIILQCAETAGLPPQVRAEKADPELVAPYIARYCETFGEDPARLCGLPYMLLTPNSRNPYRQLYTFLP